MEAILDFSKPLDVHLLDNITYALYHGSKTDRQQANLVLMSFQQHPQAWSRVDTILEYSQSDETKIFACLILESVIRHRWKILQQDQRDGIKTFIVNLVIALSSNEHSLVAQQAYVTRLNVALVEILKYEWPARWPLFIQELVNSSATSESLCQNNMRILRLLSEEIFDYSKEQMVSAKAQALKEQLASEFVLIYQLCEYILDEAASMALIKETLSTLHKFLNWIPLGYIFETKLIAMLLTKFFPMEGARNLALLCMVEIASLENKDAAFEAQHVALYTGLVSQQLPHILTADTDIVSAYMTGAASEKAFVQYLALFFTGFFSERRRLLEGRGPELEQLLVEGHMILVRISAVPEEKLFRICVDYWHTLARALFYGNQGLAAVAPSVEVSNVFMHLATPEQVYHAAQRALFQPVLSNVRLLVIQRMAKPEEVFVVEDENGKIVRERQKDTASMALYKVLRDTIVFLSHLDVEETEALLKLKLSLQMNGREWSWQNLNSLCWAIGSISGTFSMEQEKRFLVHVIRDLLMLCENKRGRDNKAVVASNVLYVVGQYPRFLRAHWKFLRTVSMKLFEFMHELHPGIQDMACDTFLKIALRCRRKFVTVQPQEAEPFIELILNELPAITSDLEPAQTQTCYEALGVIIADQPDRMAREALIAKLFEWPNQAWQGIMAAAAADQNSLLHPDTMRPLANILGTNVHAALSLRSSFAPQMFAIYLDMLSVYNFYSAAISRVVTQFGVSATARVEVRLMRAVKKEVLVLIRTFVKHAEDPALIVQQFLPPLMSAVLQDYADNIPGAREAEVLALMTAMAEELKGDFTDVVPTVLAAVFECTLAMIGDDFDGFPDVRLRFFELLRAINEHCFGAFLAVPAEVFRTTVQAMVYAMQHQLPEIADIGVRSLCELLERASTSEVGDEFYRTFILDIVKAAFAVLTDLMHRTGFNGQITLLRMIIHAAVTSMFALPIFDVALNPGASNASFLHSYVVGMLSVEFPNLLPATIIALVDQMFALHGDLPAFKAHMRDFLILIRQHEVSDSQSLALRSEADGGIDLASAGGGGSGLQHLGMLSDGGSMALMEIPDDSDMAMVIDDREAAMIPGLLPQYHPITAQADMELALVEMASGPGDLLDLSDVPPTMEIEMSVEESDRSLMLGGVVDQSVIAIASAERMPAYRAARLQSHALALRAQAADEQTLSFDGEAPPPMSSALALAGGADDDSVASLITASRHNLELALVAQQEEEMTL